MADLEKATFTIVKLVQREVYAEEIQDLETRGHVKRSSKIVKLRPILDDCVMRVGGRITDAPIAFDAKCQMPNVCSAKAPCGPATDCKLSSEIITCWTKSHPCALEGEVLDT